MLPKLKVGLALGRDEVDVLAVWVENCKPSNEMSHGDAEPVVLVARMLKRRQCPSGCSSFFRRARLSASARVLKPRDPLAFIGCSNVTVIGSKVGRFRATESNHRTTLSRTLNRVVCGAASGDGVAKRTALR